MARLAYPVQRLATTWTVRGSNFGVNKRFSLLHTHPNPPMGPPSLLQSGQWGSVPELKRTWRGLDQPLPSSTQVRHGRVYIHSSPCAFVARYRVNSPLTMCDKNLMGLQILFSWRHQYHLIQGHNVIMITDLRKNSQSLLQYYILERNIRVWCDGHTKVFLAPWVDGNRTGVLSVIPTTSGVLR